MDVAREVMAVWAIVVLVRVVGARVTFVVVLDCLVVAKLVVVEVLVCVVGLRVAFAVVLFRVVVTKVV